MTDRDAGPPGGTPPPVDYGVWLTAQLAALGVSRNALARALGHRGAGAVSRWASGNVVPREGSRVAIEAALDRAASLAALQRVAESEYWAVMAAGAAPDTHEDAPGSTNADGEVSYPPSVVVERYVVEGG